DYGIKWKERAPYICTCTLSKRTFRELSNHKLNTLCDCLDIRLEHHNAGSDADACAQLLLCCAERGADVRSAIKEYDMLNIKTVSTK
ncbi:MAG: exonuclease, partial [Clostridia bacterium]|nr:exonuclease [Clostridia bacterium]